MMRNTLKITFLLAAFALCGCAGSGEGLDTNGRPVSVGHVREGDELLVLHIGKAVLPLSSSVTDPSVYPPVEAALGIPIAEYALK